MVTNWDSQGWEAATKKFSDERDLKHGWSMFSTPAARISTAQVAIIGLNPGGSEGDESWQFDGNAFVDGLWAKNGTAHSAIQQQIQALMVALQVDAQSVLIAQLVPFRSPSWNSLSHRVEALEFSKSLWEDLLPNISAPLFVCMGKEVARFMSRWFGGCEWRAYDTGWGNIYRCILADGRKVVSIPHPSRYQLWANYKGREKAVAALNAAISG